LLIQVAMQSKGRVCGHLLDEIASSNPARGMDVSLVSAVCCQVEVSAMRQSLIQSSPTECVYVSLRVIKCNNNLCTYNK
jgi:hypothetical protein